MNTSEVTLGIPLDFSKAFDTIDHLALLQKLYKRNFSVETLKLIQSYISEQRQYIQIHDKNSSTKLNNFGVPQGSILGPVLFNLYIVDVIDNISCTIRRWYHVILTLQIKKPTKLYWKVRIRPANCVRLGFTEQFSF